ncbi:hypothetical protein SNE40_001406 [Patella caerulea]|uniref:Uncharacterized protein n=1 Tax=Patella caerulea TaxID=87958 RepID=A0AAN8QB45_PATCE
MTHSSMSRISIPLESVDYILLQQEKMAKLHNQIEAVENHMYERSKLLRQIERLKAEEDARSVRVLSRLNSRNFVLNDEVARLYGTNTALDYCDSPMHPGVLDNILTHRTKEHSLAQQDKEMQIKYLMLEKRRLQEARERLHDKKQYLARNPTPLERNLSDLMPEVIMAPPKVKSASIHSVHSQGSYVRRAVDNLPQSINRIWKLRSDIEKDYNRKLKPYTGHLGLESYQPYQLEDYVIVRKLVEDFVDDCLYRHIVPVPGYSDSLRQRVAMNNEIGIWGDLSGAMSDKRLLQLIMEEIVLVETRKLSVEIVEDVLHLNGILRNLTDFTLMNRAERISTGKREGRSPDDPAYNTITKGYFSMVDSRDQHRKDIWGHSQHVHIKAKTGEEAVADERYNVNDNNVINNNVNGNNINNSNNVNYNNNNSNQDQGDETDIDTEVITFNHITPTDLTKYEPMKTDSKEIKTFKVNTERYMNREQRYWKNIESDINKISISKKCKGIQSVKPSPDNSMIAIGTVHGDIIVYDVRHGPWRAIRVVHNSSNVDDSVIDIAWTLDNSKILTINRMGSMQVWTFDGGGSGKNDAKGLDIQADSSGFLPLQLSRLVVLDDDMKDFSFKKGPFSDQGVLDGSNSPVKAAFFPSLTFLGSQHSVCVGLDNGDLLKCNLEPLLVQVDQQQDVVYLEAPRIYQENIYSEKHGVNTIGQNLEAELYRHHKYPVLYLGFIDNMSKMITVDQRGFINIWIYNSQHLSNFGWFTPFKKLKLDLSKTVYTPSDTAAPNIKFTDKEKKKKKSQKEIARDRQRVQNLLNNMMLGDPWHEETLREQGLVTSIYPAKGAIKERGALFNVVIRHSKTDQLSTYLTRMYKPATVRCKKILEVRQSPTGQQLIFLLLFPEFPPKGAHMTVLILNLRTLKLRNIRRDIMLSNTEYTQLIQDDVVSCDVSRVFGPTGSDYLFITLNGRVRAISLNTGKLVLMTDNTERVSNFSGLIVDEKLLPLSNNAEVTMMSSDSQLKSVYYSQKSTNLYVMTLTDKNSSEDRRMMSKSFQVWGGRILTAVEMRVDPIPLKPSGNQPIEASMRQLVLECVDKALQKKGEQLPPDNQISNREQAYKAVAKQVEKRNILK